MIILVLDLNTAEDAKWKYYTRGFIGTLRGITIKVLLII